MFWYGPSAFQLPLGGSVESNCWSWNVSSKSYLPCRREAYGPPPRLTIGPYELTVATQLSTFTYWPILVTISWNVETIWHASLMRLYVWSWSTLPPTVILMFVSGPGASLPSSAL